MNKVFMVGYSPMFISDVRLYQQKVDFPEDGYGGGCNNPPELNKIYDPKRPRYPGWWVHLFVESSEQVDDAFIKIQQYLLTNYKIKVERRGLK
jgi:hypothetical protein